MAFEALFPDISGTWTGFYELPIPEERPRSMPPTIPFTMRLVESPGGAVAGRLEEGSSLGFPEAGTIAGLAKLFSVALEIERPVLRLRYPDRLVSLEEWFREKYPEVEEINAVPHPTTYMKARLIRWNGSMAGIWWIPAGSLLDQVSGWHATYPEQVGVWQARRVPKADQPRVEAVSPRTFADGGRSTDPP